jgi:hypothetical protein
MMTHGITTLILTLAQVGVSLTFKCQTRLEVPAKNQHFLNIFSGDEGAKGLSSFPPGGRRGARGKRAGRRG